MTSLSDLIQIFCRRIFILLQSNSVQNLSRLNVRTKELGGGHPLSPVLHQPKSPMLTGLIV